MPNAVAIPFFTSAQFTESVTLDQNEFFLEFIWNNRGSFYSMDIYDSNNNKLVAGVRLIVGYSLLGQYNYAGLPLGDMMVWDPNPNTAIYEPGRNDFTN